jgi:hypothetical protein
MVHALVELTVGSRGGKRHPNPIELALRLQPIEKRSAMPCGQEDARRDERAGAKTHRGRRVCPLVENGADVGMQIAIQPTVRDGAQMRDTQESDEERDREDDSERGRSSEQHWNLLSMTEAWDGVGAVRRRIARHM